MAEAAVNLVVSILLLQVWGIAGIFVGTIVSSLSTVFWREPYLLFKNVLGGKFVQYWLQFLLCCLRTIVIGAGVYFLCALFPNQIGYFVLKVAICLIVPNLCWLLTSFWTKEFKYFENLGKELLTRLKRKKPTN